MLFVCVVLCLQYGLFTTVHKHYSVEDWVAFAKTHPDCLKVRIVCMCACGSVADLAYEIQRKGGGVGWAIRVGHLGANAIS